MTNPIKYNNVYLDKKCKWDYSTNMQRKTQFVCACSSLLKDLVYTEAKSIDFIKNSLLYFHPWLTPHGPVLLPTSTGMNVTDGFTLALSLSFALSFTLSDALTLQTAPHLSLPLSCLLFCCLSSLSQLLEQTVKQIQFRHACTQKSIYISPMLVTVFDYCHKFSII